MREVLMTLHTVALVDSRATVRMSRRTFIRLLNVISA